MKRWDDNNECYTDRLRTCNNNKLTYISILVVNSTGFGEEFVNPIRLGIIKWLLIMIISALL